MSNHKLPAEFDKLKRQVKVVVSLHGGTVEYSSKRGKGLHAKYTVNNNEFQYIWHRSSSDVNAIKSSVRQLRSLLLEAGIEIDRDYFKINMSRRVEISEAESELSEIIDKILAI